MYELWVVFVANYVKVSMFTVQEGDDSVLAALFSCLLLCIYYIKMHFHVSPASPY